MQRPLRGAYVIRQVRRGKIQGRRAGPPPVVQVTASNGVRHHPRRSRKEVFQPHLPVRLPCYDLAPVTGLALGRPSRLRPSCSPGSHGLTGGVYKARERIHRAMADARLLANPASLHGGGLQPPIRTAARFRAQPALARLHPSVTRHCNTCVAPDVRAVLI